MSILITGTESFFISSVFLYYHNSVSNLGGNDIALIRLPRVVRTIEIGKRADLDAT